MSGGEMRVMLYFILFAFAGSFMSLWASHFESCTNLPTPNTDLVACPQDQGNLNQSLERITNLESDVSDVYEQITGDTYPREKEELYSILRRKVAFLANANIEKLKLQKDCLGANPNLACQKVARGIKLKIMNNWDQMAIGAALGLKDNLRFESMFTERDPGDRLNFPKTSPKNKMKHPFGEEFDLRHDLKEQIESEYQKTISEEFPSGRTYTGPYDNTEFIHLKDTLTEKYLPQYTQAISNAPIMAYVNSRFPDNAEITAGLDRMIENNKKLLQNDLSPDELAGFTPIIESALSENPSYCSAANEWIDKKIKMDQIKNYGKLALATGTGVGCAVTSWTVIGAGTLCAATGVLLTAKSLHGSYQTLELERSRTFTSALSMEMMDGFDGLSDADKDFALELMMAPLVFVGAGLELKKFAPSVKALKFLIKIGRTPALKFLDERGLEHLANAQEALGIISDASSIHSSASDVIQGRESLE